MAFLSSCETDIPVNDVTPPYVYIYVEGPGIAQSFDSDDSQLYHLDLLAGQQYDFTGIVRDDGGVKEMHWFHRENFTLLELQPSTAVEIGSSEFLQYVHTGDPTNPVDGLIMTGTLRGDSTDLHGSYSIWGYDYSEQNLFESLYITMSTVADNPGVSVRY